MNVHAAHQRIQEYLQNQPIDGITIVSDPSKAEYILTGRYTADMYHSKLKGIIIPWTGHNGIDLEAMREEQLELYVTPTRSKYVAEKAITLMLALLGRTVEYHNQLQLGNWSSRNSDKRIPWTSIQNSKIGLFGFGRIGSLIYQFLQGFEPSIYTLERRRVYPKELKLVQTLPELIDKTDIIIISTPLNKETEGLFNKSILQKMKGKYIINVGRGKILDEQALYESLKDGVLAGYASDVWYTYPKGKENQLPSDYPFHELSNVVMSNHSGGFTNNTNKEVNQDILYTLQKLLNGDTSDQLDLSTLL